MKHRYMSKKSMLQGFIWKCDECPLWTPTHRAHLLDAKSNGKYMVNICPECHAKMHVIYCNDQKYLEEDNNRIKFVWPDAPQYRHHLDRLRLQGRLRN